ncbi:MAG: DcrB-related protein [Clostridia bacterium]|nr:DcrB-related protein [Clostridia bacterium]
MIKKLTAILLALLFCLCAFGCSAKDENAPEGMKSATVSGEPFTLYVPESWTSNTVSGISGAYYSAVDGLSVSARYYTPAEAMTKDAYLDACVASLTLEYAENQFTLTEDKAAATLGGKDALRISFEFTVGDAVTVCSQTTAEHGGDLISLYTYCPKSEYENRSETLEEIRAAFVLGEKSTASAAEVITKDTPEGMKLASDEDIEYRLFVPKTWICDPTSGASEAYYPESGKPNVTVTSFVPDTSMSVKDYFLRCEEEYKKELDGYTRTDEPAERKIDGRTAYSYTYSVTVGDTEIKIMQTVFVYDSSFYTITYTALSDSFDAHMSDVEAILNAFKFR